jgi:hypothetical protein
VPGAVAPNDAAGKVHQEVHVALTLLAQPANLRLNSDAIAKPALTSQVRPALVLPERQARALLDAASREDVGRGGCFAAGPAGIQVWSGPFDGPGGAKGSAVHLGSVDWTYDTPAKHWAMIYRAMVTHDGVERGETTTTVLARVLALTGLSVEGDRVSLPTPPVRDPFRSRG